MCVSREGVKFSLMWRVRLRDLMPTTCFLFGVTAPFSHSEVTKLPKYGEQAVPNVNIMELGESESNDVRKCTTCPQPQYPLMFS